MEHGEDAEASGFTELVLPKWEGSTAKGRAIRELILRSALLILIE